MNSCVSSSLAVLITIVGVIAYYIWRAVRKRQLLYKWAAARGVRLRDYEERRVARGPFSYMTTHRGQAVFRITVEYPDGRTSGGWALCGSWGRGLFSSEVEVSWDKGEQESLGFPVIMKKPQESDHGDSQPF